MKKCIRKVPYIAVPPKVEGGIVEAGLIMRGCCNDWLCPRCGEIRAKREYGRIIEGCKQLREAGHDLYFITLTTKGREISVYDAHETYLESTNRMFTALRKNSKMRGVYWSYVQVTEHQKRGHPHSHLITTYYPDDLKDDKKLYRKKGANGWEFRAALVSAWFQERSMSAGLGSQYDITRVRSSVATAKYVAKYLFKSLQDDKFPPNWKRVRYSRNFPQLPAKETGAFPLVSPEDWYYLGDYRGYWKAETEEAYQLARLYSMAVVRLEPPLENSKPT